MKTLPSDHRTRVTKMLIRRAFTDLLRSKPIQSITIRELCERAGINRGTFYCHYTDIYDLLHQMEEEMLEDFNKALEPLLSARGESFHPVDISTEIFQCLKDNSDLCVVTLGPHGDKAFALRLLQRGREYCFQNYARYFKGATRQQVDYCYAIVSSGCIGMLGRWLEDGMQMPPAELARMAEGVIQYGYGYLIRGEEELTAPAGDAAPAGEKNFKT